MNRLLTSLTKLVAVKSVRALAKTRRAAPKKKKGATATAATKNKNQGVTKGRCFKTHDNGARPYRVCISSAAVTIEYTDYARHIKEPRQFMSKGELTPFSLRIDKPDKVWVGDNGEGCAGYEPKGPFRGSAILVKKGDTFTFVGENVRQFTLKNDEILAFYSPMGNSNVPYSYAVGQKNTYLFSEKKGNKIGYMTNADLAERGTASPYDTYYALVREKKEKKHIHFTPCKYLHKYNR